ncbi:hypothetical protein TRFO_01283 [Tritrichomonas foetus]|uniref:PAS domain-containing protein n=1 Tax=Tritrichomonas foetus TaxID=1144522 RepID=A0A1J4K708_9EUKA|nr:hypothetical protein TRFO_01283 [Tritrichomonas foetus]|eukprot:OHT07159.1 hypothetical protein TRFO_01283 [Tritrichomonas foetus]
MISPGEKFNAFSTNRLIKKEENTAFGFNQKLVISPTKNSFFLFVHLVNRSITNIPWLFWISLIAMFIQCAIAVIQPFNESHWEGIPEMKPIVFYLSIILRYVPLTAPPLVSTIIFAIYSVLVIAHFILVFVIVTMMKNKKDTNILIKIFFFYSYLVLPLFRSSLICVISEQVTQIVRNPSFGTFFLSLFALIILILQLIMTGFVQFIMGSSPSPNLVNPLAIWGPCAWRSVIFEEYVCLCIAFLEFIRSISNNVIYAIMIVVLLLFSVPHSIYQSVRTYYISYTAYEYIGALLWAITAFTLIHLFICFIPSKIPYIAILVVWISLPVMVFIIMRSITLSRIKKVLRELDQCGTLTSAVDDTGYNNQEEFDVEHTSSVYDSITCKNSSQAIFIARAACVTSHPVFTDLSLLQYFVDRFPSGLFFFLYLAFLVQNQQVYVQKLIDLYLEESKPGILQSCVLFQIITSMQESSNDLPQSLIRELGKQKLQAMKCQQLLSKFWTSCYKGDITQMSRHAFTLNRHIKDLTNNWKLLILRYPFSTPVLKDYIQYLSTTGTQHKIVEAILTNHPQLNDITTNQYEQQDLNTPILHQAVEDAVDRRPIYSISKIQCALAISIMIALLFLIFIVALSFILLNSYNSYNEFIYQSECFVSVFANIPNLFDDVIFSGDSFDSRSIIFQETEDLANSLNSMLLQMPKTVLDSTSLVYHPLYIQVDRHNETKKTDFINMLRLTAYFARCLSFVPIDDISVSLVIKNWVDTIGVLETTMTNTIVGIEEIVNVVVTYSPIFYALNWILLLLIMIPLLYISITALKDEMTYLFSIYLTIPRSTITKFIDSSGGKQQDKKNTTLFLSTSFAHHTTTTSMRDDDENEGRANVNIADGFKMLVNDSSANISVLPKNFVLKAVLIFSFLCGIIAVLSTVGCFLFISFSNSLIECFYTQKTIADRTSGSSISMHGVTSCGEDIDPTLHSAIIQQTAKLHTAILFKDSSYNLSNKALADSDVVNIQSGERCSNQTDFACRSLVSLFDYFINQVSNASSYFKNSTVDRNANNYETIRRIYNDNLYPLLFETQKELYEFTKDQINNFRTEILIIIIISFAVIALMFFFCVRPVMLEVNQSIEAVKLPLKHINPVEIVDLQKVLMYLQGESDFKRGGQNEKGNESQGGNSILNVMLCPFAIFEDDLSLLFANSAFYSILGTSREAVIGLPLSDIFANVMTFKSNESHPFNSLLDTVSQLQRGVAPVNVIEIRTELEVNNQSPCPVMIRLVGICQTTHNEDEDENKQNLKASSYALFINDLSHKRALEEKMKYETEVSQKLVDSIIPKSLLNVIRNGDSLEAHKFDNIPMCMFTIKFNAPEEEFEDELMIACSLFMRTANDVNQNFAVLVTKLIQDPPVWYYISGYDNQHQENLSIAISDLCHFALSVIEVYNASSTTNYALGAVIHVGQLSVIPMQLRLPMVEALGSGFSRLKEIGQSSTKPGLVQCTPEIEALIGEQKAFILTKDGNDHLFSLKRGAEPTRTDDAF